MKKLQLILIKYLLSLKSYALSRSLIISSETRGGSTWLMEMLANIDGVIINWEPLHPTRGVVPKVFKWGDRPYIDEKDDNEEARQMMGKILTLKVYNQRSIQYNTSIIKTIKSEIVLTKFCRSNLLLPWLVRQFSLKYKPIYLLRHPIAVALSQIKNFHSEKPLSKYLVPDCMSNERYLENQQYLNSLSSKLERYVALWCIHNVEIIKHPQKQNWLPIFYEELVLNPQKNLNLIAAEWGLKIDTTTINFSKPSSSNFMHSFQVDKMKQLNKWKNELSKNELLCIQRIFDKY